MSLPETAADQLRFCLAELTPLLLAAVSELRQSQPTQALLPFGQVLDILKPLISKPLIKQAFVLTDSLSMADKNGAEVRIRNLCLEIGNNELRKVVLEDPAGLIAGSETTESALASTFDRLDVVLALSLQDLIDPTLPLTLVEELIESQPIPTCSRLFGYTESRVKPLTIDLHPTRGKGLVLLRTCNELLRRLSKPSQQHTVFAGRILSLLAAVFPLGERSGVNLRGDFNVENKTHIEQDLDGNTDELDDDVDKDERDQIFKVDYEFYELFWKVQRFFSNPLLLMADTNSSRPSTRSVTPAPVDGAEAENEDPAPDGAKGAMPELRISTRKILKLFGAVTRREKELAGATSAEEAKAGASKSGTSTPQASGVPSKRRSENGNAQAPTGYFVGQLVGRHTQEPPRKRLRPDVVNGVTTDSRDGDEAMEDESRQVEREETTPADGGHFFPTYLTGRKLFEYEIRDTSFRKHVLVQYLVLFQYLLSFTPAAKENWKDWKNKTLQALFTLEEADERWIRSTWREIQALIREIQPDGRIFLESVLEVLKREENWIRWKTGSCPSIEKPPLSPEQISAFASARALLLRKHEAYPHKLGTAALSELWADGLRPSAPGTRRVENEEGEYVTVATDGLEELEFMPPIPDLQHYNKSIQREKMKLDMRKKQLGIDPASDEAQLGKDEKEKLDNDERIQATIETMQSLAWRALRVASRDNLHLFGKPDRPENIDGLLKAMEEERNPKPKAAPVKKEPAATDDAGKGADKPTEPVDSIKEALSEAAVVAESDNAVSEDVEETKEEGEAETVSPLGTDRNADSKPTKDSAEQAKEAEVSSSAAATQKPENDGEHNDDTVSPWDTPANSAAEKSKPSAPSSQLDDIAAKEKAAALWEGPASTPAVQEEDVEMSQAP